MKITRRSKCIYIINNTRNDIRKYRRKHHLNVMPLRAALHLYLERSNPRLTFLQIDSVVCRMLNKKIGVHTAEALESQTVFV